VMTIETPAQPPGATPQETVSFLFTDIEGSTRLGEQTPTGMRAALAAHDTLLHQLFPAQEGFVFRTMGDSFCVAFASPVEALAAALAAQRALGAVDWPTVAPGVAALKVRMAVHTGVVEVRAGDYWGPPLNRVARLLAAGHGGQILLSAATQELVRDRLPDGVQLRDLGAHRLRDLVRPEQIFQVTAPDLPAEFPALRTLDSVPHNLPLQLTSFIGREQEMATLPALLDQNRLLTLIGPGGTGKTRLSLQMAADRQETLPDGVWLVELAPIGQADLVPAAVAAALGVQEEAARPLMRSLIAFLKAKTLLLILDNCEHLVAACAQLADTLLRQCPNLRILATSREGLGVSGEVLYPVSPLGVPDLKHLPSPAQLGQYAAVRLFIERAVAVRPDFAVTNDNAPAVAQICARLDGIPLAIELAAARIAVMPVEQLAARLKDRFRLLRGGLRTALPRQQTLRALIDWSWDLLPDAERAVLRRLAIFAGGADLAAAEAVCSGADLAAYEVLDGLAALVAKSLVTVDTVNGTARYRLLETVGQYAAEQLAAAGEADAVAARHAAWALALAAITAPALRGADQLAALAQLTAEQENLRAALAWSREAAPETHVALATALGPFWLRRGAWSEGRTWLAQALATGAGTPRERARLQIQAGELIWQQDVAGVRPLLEAGIATARQEGDQQTVSDGLLMLGRLVLAQSDLATATAHFTESLTLRRALGEPGPIAAVLRWLSRSDWEQAATYLAEAFSLAQAGGDRRVLADVLWEQSAGATDKGAFAEATTLAEAGRNRMEELGDLAGRAMFLDLLGGLALQQGTYLAATRYADEVIAEAQHLGAADVLANGWKLRGEIALLTGAWARAAECFGTARRLAEEQGLAVPVARLATLQARLALVADGDYERAAALYREALTQVPPTPNAGLEICTAGMAAVALAAGQPARAARLLGALRTIRAAGHLTVAPADQAWEAATEAAARAALGAAAWTATWTAGQALSTAALLADLAEGGAAPSPARPVYPHGLTTREVDVLRLVAAGLTDNQIAEQLVLSRRTVHSHLHNAYQKIGVTTRAAATRVALAEGLV